VQGPRRRPHSKPWRPLLALWVLAVVFVGQLAAAGAAELPEVRRSVLLVAQPKKHQLRGLRNANMGTLTEAHKGGIKGGQTRPIRMKRARKRPEKIKNGH
jgi:hypothetical protein